MPKYYAVRNGRRTGVFNTWEECHAQVNGYSRAEYQSFRSRAEAERYVYGDDDGGYGGDYDYHGGGYQQQPNYDYHQGYQPADGHANYGGGGGGRGVLYFDGGARGNPGPAGAGCVLYDQQGRELARDSQYLGDYETNNVAEYEGLILGLKLAERQGIRHLEVHGDSSLVVNQLNGQWQVNAPGLIPLHEEADRLRRSFHPFSITYVPRHQNGVADALANQAMDRRQGYY